MKQKSWERGYRIDAAKVRTLVEITAMRGKRQVFDIIAAAVLSGDDVFEVIRQSAPFLGKQSIFADSAGAAPHEIANAGLHPIRSLTPVA